MGVQLRLHLLQGPGLVELVQLEAAQNSKGSGDTATGFRGHGYRVQGAWLQGSGFQNPSAAVQRWPPHPLSRHCT